MRLGLDLDGTLLSCAERHTALMRAAARRVGASFDGTAFWMLKREGCNNRAALLRLGLPAPTAGLMDSIWAMAVESLQWLTFDRRLVAAETLAAAVRRGHSLHLFTARRNAAHARQQLARCGLLAAFSTIDVLAPDRAATAKATALAARGCDLLIGDSEVDLDAARIAAIRVRAVSSGMRSPAFLHAAGQHQVWPDINPCLEDL